MSIIWSCTLPISGILSNNQTQKAISTMACSLHFLLTLRTFVSKKWSSRAQEPHATNSSPCATFITLVAQQHLRARHPSCKQTSPQRSFLGQSYDASIDICLSLNWTYHWHYLHPIKHHCNWPLNLLCSSCVVRWNSFKICKCMSDIILNSQHSLKPQY